MVQLPCAAVTLLHIALLCVAVRVITRESSDDRVSQEKELAVIAGGELEKVGDEALAAPAPLLFAAATCTGHRRAARRMLRSDLDTICLTKNKQTVTSKTRPNAFKRKDAQSTCVQKQEI